jgi:hypothetical protein
MIKSILIGLILPSFILISGWVRVLFSFISFRFGNGVPALYFFLGVSFGIGDYYKNLTSYWITYIAGMLLSILILKWSSNHDSKRGESSSTVTLCGTGFIIGGLLGMIIGLIF